MPERPPLSQPEDGSQLRRRREAKIQSLHRASQVWLPWSQRKNAVIPLRSTGKGSSGGVPSPFRRGEIPLGDSPSPHQAERLQPAGPLLLHPVGVRGCRSPRRCPAPLQSCPPPGRKGQCCPNKAIGSQKLLPKITPWPARPPSTREGCFKLGSCFRPWERLEGRGRELRAKCRLLGRLVVFPAPR